MKSHNGIRILSSRRFAAVLLLSIAAGVANVAPGQTEPASNAPTATARADRLQFNFRGAPLDTILDYMSEAAGFIILRTVDVQGAVDMVSQQPVTVDEAVELLDTVLHDKGYAAVRNGRVLAIVALNDARFQNLPVRAGADPETLERSEQMVVHIMPIRYAKAEELLDNLSPLLPEYATISANASANALIITATQNDIYRLAQIVGNLDQVEAQYTTVRVYPLVHADATEMAQLITAVLAPRESSNANNPVQMMIAMNAAAGGRGGRGGANFDMGPMAAMAGAMGGEGSASSESVLTTTADERTNSLIVRASDDLFPRVEELIAQLDRSTAIDNVVEIFRLKNADAEATAQTLTETFGQQANLQVGGGAQAGFAPGGFGGRGAMPGNFNTGSSGLNEPTVTFVADTRTNSVIASAPSATMDNVARVIEQLDANPRGSKTLAVFDVNNANPEEVAALLQSIFSGSGTAGRSSLTNRRSTTTGGFGNSATGTSSGARSSRNTSTSRRTGGSGSSSGGIGF